MSDFAPDGPELSAGQQYRTLLAVSQAIVSQRDLHALFHELAGRLHPVARFDFLSLVLHEAASPPGLVLMCKVIGVLGIGRDITARNAAEREIEQLAYYDPLTQLPNRRLLMHRLQNALDNVARTRGRTRAPRGKTAWHMAPPSNGGAPGAPARASAAESARSIRPTTSMAPSL